MLARQVRARKEVERTRPPPNYRKILSLSLSFSLRCSLVVCANYCCALRQVGQQRGATRGSLGRSFPPARVLMKEANKMLMVTAFSLTLAFLSLQPKLAKWDSFEYARANANRLLMPPPGKSESFQA